MTATRTLDLPQFLEDAGLAQLAAPLSGKTTLARLVKAIASKERPALLAELKEYGLPLGDRQKLANALYKARREDRLPAHLDDDELWGPEATNPARDSAPPP
eukprot:6690816-Prymnesium_polylepis.1